jgi:hypothetical protein
MEMLAAFTIKMKWDGFTVTTIPVGQLVPAESSLVYKICKVPLIVLQLVVLESIIYLGPLT